MTGHPSTIPAMSIGLQVSSSALIPDGTQIWLQGKEVVDVTTEERAAFWAMFGLMRIPTLQADGVVLSTADFEAFEREATAGRP